MLRGRSRPAGGGLYQTICLVALIADWWVSGGTKGSFNVASFQARSIGPVGGGVSVSTERLPTYSQLHAVLRTKIPR